MSLRLAAAHGNGTIANDDEHTDTKDRNYAKRTKADGLSTSANAASTEMGIAQLPPNHHRSAADTKSRLLRRCIERGQQMTRWGG